MTSPRLTPQLAIQRIRHYCAYQERCHSEVREKLYSFGLRPRETEAILAQLITDNFLNEERFAVQFAGGKFRISHWGRNRIRSALRQKQVSEYCIRKALSEIPEADYHRLFLKTVTQRTAMLRHEKNIFVKKRKLQDYLLQRGFETDLVREAVRGLQNR